MTEPTYTYPAVQLAIKQINQVLLKGQKGILLRATVNKHNEIIDIDFVGVQEALENGIALDGLVSKA